MAGVGLFLAALRRRLATPSSAADSRDCDVAETECAQPVLPLLPVAQTQPVLPAPLDTPIEASSSDRNSLSVHVDVPPDIPSSSCLPPSLVDYESDSSDGSLARIVDSASHLSRSEPARVHEKLTMQGDHSGEDRCHDALIGPHSILSFSDPEASLEVDALVEVLVSQVAEAAKQDCTGSTAYSDEECCVQLLAAERMDASLDGQRSPNVVPSGVAATSPAAPLAISPGCSPSRSPGDVQCVVAINSPVPTSGDNSLESFADIALRTAGVQTNGLWSSPLVRSVFDSTVDSTLAPTVADTLLSADTPPAADTSDSVITLDDSDDSGDGGFVAPLIAEPPGASSPCFSPPRPCHVLLERLPEPQDHTESLASQTRGRYGVPRTGAARPLRIADLSSRKHVRFRQSPSTDAGPFQIPSPSSTTDSPRDKLQKTLKLKAALRGIRLPPRCDPGRSQSRAQSAQQLATEVKRAPSSRPAAAATARPNDRDQNARPVVVAPIAKRAPVDATADKGDRSKRLIKRVTRPQPAKRVVETRSPVGSSGSASQVEPVSASRRSSRSRGGDTSGVISSTTLSAGAECAQKNGAEPAVKTPKRRKKAAASPARGDPPSAKRAKGDHETRLRAEYMAQPSLIFASAAGRGSKVTGRPKAAPVAIIPPSTEAVRTRPQLAPGALKGLISRFVARRASTLRLSELQHLERLEVVRTLILIAYSDTHDVAPLLRLLVQNGRTENDPVAAIAVGLQPALIDTRFNTQSSSAQLLIFNYLVPLFLQRWAIMAPATTAVEQWRSIAQTYNNWSGLGRWPECFLVAPEETVELARRVLEDSSCSLSSNFQEKLGAVFIRQRALAEQWVRVRRCSAAVSEDKTGLSMFVDLIVSPNALWLVSSPKHQLCVDRAYKKVNKTALNADPSMRVVYPQPDVYLAALSAITDVLVSASANVAHIRRIDRTLQAPLSVLAERGWITYNGVSTTVAAGVAELQLLSPTTVRVAPELDSTNVVLTCGWPATETAPLAALSLTIPTDTLRSAFAPSVDPSASPPQQCSSASPLAVPLASTSHVTQPVTPLGPALLISGLHGTFERVRLLNAFTAFGVVDALCVDPAAASVTVHYNQVGSAQKALACLYALLPRQPQVHGVILDKRRASLTDVSLLHDLTDEDNLCVLGCATNVVEPNTAVYFAAMLVEAVEQEQPTTDLLDDLRLFLLASATATTQRSCPLELLSALVTRLALTPGAQFDMYAARLEVAKSLDGATNDHHLALSSCLRLLALHHLRAHRFDEVYVLPFGWFDPAGGLTAAARPPPLCDGNGKQLDPGDCRILLIPFCSSSGPALIVVGFPQSLRCQPGSAFAPIVVVIGGGNATPATGNLLTLLFVRLEAVLCEGWAIRRPKCVISDILADAQVGVVSSVAHFGLADIPLLLTHAARLWLRFLSTPNETAVFSDVFTDATLIAGTKALLRRYSSGQEVTPHDAVNEYQREIDAWRLHQGETQPRLVSDAPLLGATAYDLYLAIAAMRRAERSDWIELDAATTYLAEQTSTALYVSLNQQMLLRCGVLEKALTARLHQLHRRGFSVVSSWKQVIELRRGPAENAWLKLPDLSLHSVASIYTDWDEISLATNGWSTPPVWFHR